MAVVGCGAIGRKVALAWAEMGVGHLLLWDDDTVSEENLGPQGWRPDQIGAKKVDALSTDLLGINPATLVITISPTRLLNLMPVCVDVIHLCVDNMEARKRLVESHVIEGEDGPLVVDSRMGAMFSRTVAVWDEESRAKYLAELYTDGEGETGQCTLRSTAFMAGVGANVAVGTAALWLATGEAPQPRDVGVGANGWRFREVDASR